MQRNNNTLYCKLKWCFMLFAVIVFALLWLLQTVFLQKIYNAVAEIKLRRTAEKLEEQKESDKFLQMIDEAAQGNSYMIFVLKEDGTILYHSDAYNNMYRYNSSLNTDDRNPYRIGSEEDSENTEGEAYSWKSGAAHNLPDGFENLLQSISGKEIAEMYTDDGTAFLYLRRVENCRAFSGQNVLLSINYSFVSVAGTVRIIRLELVALFLLVLLIAAIAAVKLSRHFAYPIEEISEKARLLSEYDKEVTFPRGFCLELDNLSGTLERAKHSLNLAEKTRRELLANITHDLRTPLTMIRGYSEMIRDISWDNEDDREHDLNVIINETDRLTGLVNEILEYSRIKECGYGAAAAKMEVFDLSQAWHEVAIQFEGVLHGLPFLLEEEVKSGVLVCGDRTQLVRAMYNLMDNALNHCSENGTIRVVIEKREGAGYFEVSNDGERIEEEDLPYVWDRYYTSRKRKNKNTVSGLGLAITKEILESHRADYGVISADRTTFWFSVTES